MKINKIAIGNHNEAFIENNLSNGVNIIFSDDNNKGKTLIIQGLMYSLGNEPIFPSGFNYAEYYFYVDFTINDTRFEFLRKKDIVIVNHEGLSQICETISELKYYINKNIFPLPVIIKSGESKLVDLMLFYQLFFVGQDGRDSSNIINKGYYNKDDFIKLLHALNGDSNASLGDDNIESLKEKINKTKEQIAELKKVLKFNKENPRLSEFVQKSGDNASFERKSKRLEKIQREITNLKNKRYRELNRKVRLSSLIDELNSLNRHIDSGKVVCGTCGSDNIIFSNKDVKFDVSNKVIRKGILGSIQEQISMKNEIIGEYTRNINLEQEKLSSELKSVPVEVQKLLLYKYEILSEKESDDKLNELLSTLAELKADLKLLLNETSDSKLNNELMKEGLVNIMNTYYKLVDPNGNLVFDDLFTKKGTTYSGSEGQEFYFSKIISFNNYFKHNFPIIVDSFRSGELSSNKEIIMLREYDKLGKQVILTSTLKTEEYDKEKYSKIEGINSIDYSNNQDSKILQEKFANQFEQILNSFNILN